MKTVLSRAVAGLGVLLAGLIVAGHGGALHPAGDSLAVFRWELSLALLPLAVLLAPLGRRRLAAALALTAIVAGGPILWSMRPADAGDGFRLYQKNVWIGNGQGEAILTDIRASGADIVTLQEVHRRHDPMVADLRRTHPGWQRCHGGIHVFSRLPLADGGGRCLADRGLAVALLHVETRAGPVWIASVHLSWPWPREQADEARRIAHALAPLDGPVVVAGDFNMVPWGHAFRQIAGAVGAVPAGPLRATHHIPGLGLPPLRIDHVLVPRGWAAAVERRGKLGSDHVGLLARIGP